MSLKVVCIYVFNTLNKMSSHGAACTTRDGRALIILHLEGIRYYTNKEVHCLVPIVPFPIVAVLLRASHRSSVGPQLC